MIAYIDLRMRVFTVLLLGTILLPKNLEAQDGAAIFNQNCAVCHKIGGGKFIGPDLQGVNDKRSEDWLIKFIKSSQSLINSGDADAKALYQEFNQLAMPNFPLSDDEIKAVLSHIASAGPASAGAGQASGEAAAPQEEPEFTAEEAKEGKSLFVGTKSFENNGPACVSCHNVNSEDIAGGLLARDLTTAYDRLGGGLSIMGLLNAAPFPAMTASYGDKPLTETEVKQLTAFLKEVKSAGADGSAMAGDKVFYSYGVIILLILLIAIQLLWSRRRKETVKHDIYKRQLKTY